MKQPLTLLTGLLLTAPLGAQIEHGTFRIDGNDIGTLRLAPAKSPGVLVDSSSNSGDYHADLVEPDPIPNGVMVSCAAENLRDGTPRFSNVFPWATEPEYFIPVFVAVFGTQSEAEGNGDISFAWFPYSGTDVLGGVATNSENGGVITSFVASPGLTHALLASDPDANLVELGGGEFTLDLRSVDPDATPENGVLLVNSAENEDNYALSMDQGDGTFRIFSRDISSDASAGEGYEQDSIAFAYVPADSSDPQVVAVGRVDGNGQKLAAGGDFSVAKVPNQNGTWFLSIPGHSDQTGTLLVSPEGGESLNLDNFVNVDWEPAVDAWVVQSRDIRDTASPLLQNLGDQAAFSFVFLAAERPVVHVDDSATGANDGSSWADAFADLNAALASVTGGEEVRVAAGTYTPGATRESTFAMPPDVAIYGGFPDGGGTMEARDPAANPTILSGDIGVADDISDNCFHVVTATGTNKDSLLDGFTIAGGNADGDSGLRQHLGGGILVDGSGQAAFRDLVVTGCEGTIGGGAYFNEASPIFRNVAFVENRAPLPGTSVTGEGGAIYSNNSSPVFRDCEFYGNVAAADGGAISNHSSTIVMSGCRVVGNVAGESGGGLYRAGGSFVLAHPSIVANVAGTVGGGVTGSSMIITSGILWGNEAPSAPQNGSGLDGTSSNVLVEGATVGGDIVSAGDPRFVRHPFSGDGDWATPDDNDYGDLRLRTGSAAIDRGNDSYAYQPYDRDGVLRSIDGDLDGVAGVDLGPFEAGAPTISADGEIHRWTFNGTLEDSVGNATLTLEDGARLVNGKLVLDGIDDNAFTCAPIPATLGAKTLVAWVSPSNLDQQRGGVMTVNRDINGSDTFDSIVFGERISRRWENGSNLGNRSNTDNGAFSETLISPDEVMIAIAYHPDSSIDLYRNGAPYSPDGAADKGTLVTYPGNSATIRFGERHPNTTDTQRFFAGAINEARLYAGALSAGELAGLFAAGPTPGTGPATGDNLTAGARVRQSSTEPAVLPERNDPGQAIDSRLTNATMTAAADDAAWLEVELVEDSMVAAVELVNVSGGSDCPRARLRDITIELRDAAGAVLASSPLLNPGNAGYSFPDGPAELRHEFSLATPVRFVRVSRAPDATLAASFGNGGLAEANSLSLAEVRVRGMRADEPVVRPLDFTYDSRRADPLPLSQGWQQAEFVVGSDGIPPDGLIVPGANAGFITAGSESVWQLNDQLTDGSNNSPGVQKALSLAELAELHELGWVMEAELQVIQDGASNSAGFLDWGFPVGDNPGWTLDAGASPGVRTGFIFRKDEATNALIVEQEGGDSLTLGADSADSFHTLRVVGEPRSTEYEWFVDEVKGGDGDLGTNGTNDTGRDFRFASGNSNEAGRVMNWRRVSLRTVDRPTLPGAADLRVYFQAESGDSSGTDLFDRAGHPEGPYNGVWAGSLPVHAPGQVGESLTLAPGSHIDLSSHVDEFAGLTEGSVSLWFKPATDEPIQTLFALSDSGAAEEVTALRYYHDLDVLSFISDDGVTVPVASSAVDAADADDGHWHHVVVTFGGNVGRIFYDGVSGGPGAFQWGDGRFEGADSFTIGTWINSLFPGGAESFSGGIDDFAIWDRKLSPDEALALYHQGYLGGGLNYEVDEDGDGIPARQEAFLLTSDQSTDSDGDGIPDAEELELGTNPAKRDTDGDGIPDAEEIANGTNPRLADSDGDGFDDRRETLLPVLEGREFERMPDGKIAFTFEAYGAYSELWLEGSTGLGGFTRLAEAMITPLGEDRFLAEIVPAGGLRFFRAASDAGVLTDPFDATSHPALVPPDTDGEGLDDGAELVLGTDPLLPDTDDDDYSDYVEVMLGSDPLDPLSTPAPVDSDGDGLTDAQELALGTRADRVDSDDDTFSDHVEVNAGSNPNSAASLPDGAVLITEAFFYESGTRVATIDFELVGSGANLRMQSSADLLSFPDLGSASIDDLGGGRYRATGTAPPGHRFFRVAIDGAGGTVTTFTADFDLPQVAVEGSLQVVTDTLREGGEGTSFSQAIQFTGTFTGYLSYEISGVLPNGATLPPTAGVLEVNGASTADLVFNLVDDLAVGSQARYTITLVDNAGIAGGAESSFTLVANENDLRWSGTLGSGGEDLNFVLEALDDGVRRIERLHSPDTSGFLPVGSFPMAISYAPGAFSATLAGPIPLLRSGGETSATPGTIEALSLTASGEDAGDPFVFGTFTMTLAPASGPSHDTSGDFELLRQTPDPPEAGPALEDNN